MLQHFEPYTEELNEAERGIAKSMAKGLQGRIGKDMAIKSTEIIQAYQTRGVSLSGAKVRKLVNYICHTWLPNLIGTSKGYYISNDTDELKRAAGTLISRANENNRRADTIFDYLKTLNK